MRGQMRFAHTEKERASDYGCVYQGNDIRRRFKTVSER